MAMRKSKVNEIQRITNLISANISIAESHPELKENLGNANEKLREQLEELKSEPVRRVKNNRTIIDSDQKEVTLGKCKAVVGTTNKPCCNTEVYDGYCLIHLKQRNPKKAEEYQEIRLKDKFGLTDQEINQIRDANNGKLWNVSKAFIGYIKSYRRTQ